VRKGRLSVLLLGLIVVLAACGRVPSSSGASESPSAGSSPSPTATAPPLAILRPTFHPGEVGLAYAPVTLSATGGNDPFLWRVSDGALPGGVNISVDGTISGTPTASGNFTFTLDVTDAGMATATVTGSINVIGQLGVATPSLHAAEQNLRYSPVTFQATDGVPPYVWRVIGGVLPPGLQLSSDGVVSGTSTVGGKDLGTYRLTVQVTDAMGATASTTGSITAVGFVAGYGPAGNLVQSGCTTTWNGVRHEIVNGGLAPYSYRVIPAATGLPPGTDLKGWYDSSIPAYVAGLFVTDPSALHAALPKRFEFDVQVTDALGGTSTLRWMYDLYNDPSCTASASPSH
jgi:hypothetical protein